MSHAGRKAHHHTTSSECASWRCRTVRPREHEKAQMSTKQPRRAPQTCAQTTQTDMSELQARRLRLVPSSCPLDQGHMQGASSSQGGDTVKPPA
eukprot:87544-Chlamydomonas_euryale.AAC.2